MKKFPLFEYYTFRFPNNSPDKLSVYVLGWFCIALFGLCIALWDVPAAILVVVFLGLILTGVMLRVNFRTFQLKNPRSVPFLLLGHSLAFLPSIAFAVLYWQSADWRCLAGCGISALLVSLLLGYCYYRWQKRAPIRDSLNQLHEKTDQSLQNSQVLLETGHALQSTINSGFKGVHMSLEQQASVTDLSLKSLGNQLADTAGQVTRDLKQHIRPEHISQELDHWATVPDCVNKILDMLEEDGYLGHKGRAGFPFDTVRINIQKRLKERNAEVLRSCNANFYQTMDIASEAAKETGKYTRASFLAEFNQIASPRHDLKRMKKQEN